MKAILWAIISSLKSRFADPVRAKMRGLPLRVLRISLSYSHTQMSNPWTLFLGTPCDPSLIPRTCTTFVSATFTGSETNPSRL
ncbi:uncharacterized protein PHACADRAFT_261548 [Phanerochaete carnosa HHB-10118-sp]|uniref:Uncharacterized protein n=1 Tax=Phanerochaete carnosa (strain HHB-10118-sp) TaxID=650164 RepID=K5W1B3_PHACS|nr:uncharacterized protein PHACADRAFT_261548 [Phanerochaete carnosa HHB-10118-sp]EKM52880.1 hypothetical protein PHACADRAFT_261548 [Phanerochaete carnosa HHB-10118-sp]